MSKPTTAIGDLFEDKARAGDGAFAIAFALLRLAEANTLTAEGLDRLGLNYLSPAGPPGALEKLAMEATRIADALERRTD